ncbi:hypothetical protein [Sulfurospirillum cavolei]|uniref:hypothetical protein n=1 Tax=Sulfurospirillum cavolei TaxID=366522 RepID=UPI000764BC6B|nr:hypothetical protein [Sulfurospirillum cavolei]
MISIIIGSIFILIAGYILKKFKKDISTIESEINSSSENNQNDDSLSYEAIKQALDNKQNIDK